MIPGCGSREIFPEIVKDRASIASFYRYCVKISWKNDATSFPSKNTKKFSTLSVYRWK